MRDSVRTVTIRACHPLPKDCHFELVYRGSGAEQTPGRERGEIGRLDGADRKAGQRYEKSAERETRNDGMYRFNMPGRILAVCDGMDGRALCVKRALCAVGGVGIGDTLDADGSVVEMPGLVLN